MHNEIHAIFYGIHLESHILVGFDKKKFVQMVIYYDKLGGMQLESPSLKSIQSFRAPTNLKIKHDLFNLVTFLIELLFILHKCDHM